MAKVYKLHYHQNEPLNPTLVKGRHYFCSPDNKGLNPLFYDGDNLISKDGKILPPTTKNIFPIRNESYHLRHLETLAKESNSAANFMKKNLGQDVTSENVDPNTDSPGLDGS